MSKNPHKKVFCAEPGDVITRATTPARKYPQTKKKGKK
jgi:hypothetical protein